MSYRLSKKVLLLRLSQPFFDLYSVWLSDLVDFCISGDKASYLSNVVSSLPNISLVLIFFFMWQQQLALWDTRIPRGTVKVRLSILSIGDVVTTCNSTLHLN